MRPILYTPSGRAGEYASKGYACNHLRGCVNGCIYCYAKDVMHMRAEDFHSGCNMVDNAQTRLRNDLERLGKLDEPIFLSFTTDPYQSEYAAFLTRSVIKTIHESGNFVRILTKSPSRAQRDFDILGPNDEFGITMTCGTGYDSRRWEPNADLPHVRYESLKMAHDCGIGTWVSFEPVIIPPVTLRLISEVYPYADTIKVGKLNYENKLPPVFREAVKDINWGEFAKAAVDLLLNKSCCFYIKADLAAYLPPEYARQSENYPMRRSSGSGPQLAPGQSVEEFCDAYQKANM